MSKPVKIAEVDLSAQNVLLRDEDRYGSAFVLIRNGVHVLDMMRLPFREGLISRTEIVKAGRHKFGYKLALDDLKQYTAIPTWESSSCIPISIVVCTRNRTELLRSCIEALQRLDYPEYEILIVDNAPDNDLTKELVLSKGLRYIREELPGLDRARNRGIRESAHSIVAFTDDDARPDRNWLKAIAKNFRDEAVMAVTGYVAPAELETHAQQLFEWSYGGMGHGFNRRVFNGATMGRKSKLAASALGVGANMAFRRQWFERGGYFDPALDVGTPSSGGGDIEMFHRVVATDAVLVYDPDVLVWHLHRPDMNSLYKQVYNNGRSFVCYLLTCYRNGTTGSGTLLSFFLYNWLYQWHIKNLLFGKGRVSRKLLLTELKGMLTGVSAYRSSMKFVGRTSGL